MKLVDTETHHGKIVFKSSTGAYVALSVEEAITALHVIQDAVNYRLEGKPRLKIDGRKV